MISSQVLVVQDARRWFASISFWFRDEYIALVRSFTIIGEIIIANYLIAVTYRNRHFVPTCDGPKKVLSSSFYWFFKKIFILREAQNSVGLHELAYVCEGHTHMSDVCLNYSLPDFYTQSLSVNLKFTGLVHWLGNKAHGSACLHYSALRWRHILPP